jgi:hypothetical protein
MRKGEKIELRCKMKQKHTYRYDPGIQEPIKEKLIEREALCEKAVPGNAPLSWSIEHDANKLSIYTLMKTWNGKSTIIAQYSEPEVMSLSDKNFQQRIDFPPHIK